MVSLLYQDKCLLSLNSSISLPLFNIKDTLINKIKVSIPNTYTPTNPKKLGQVGQLYKSLKKKKSLCGNLANRLPNRKFPPVIYNTPFTGTCQSFFSSPSINWSALFGQTLFQKAHFKDGLFEKERKAKKISPKKQTQGEMKR